MAEATSKIRTIVPSPRPFMKYVSDPRIGTETIGVNTPMKSRAEPARPRS